MAGFRRLTSSHPTFDALRPLVDVGSYAVAEPEVAVPESSVARSAVSGAEPEAVVSVARPEVVVSVAEPALPAPEPGAVAPVATFVPEVVEPQVGDHTVPVSSS